MAENKFVDLRGEIDRLISSSSVESAAARIDTLWRHETSPASAAFIISRIEKLRDRLNLAPLRVAVVRSFTLEPAIPLLRAAAFRYRIDLQVHTGGFNAYAQEVLDQESALYRSAPDVVILAVRTADIAPDLWQEYSALTPSAIRDAAERVCGTLSQLIASFREHSQAALIAHTLEQPPRTALGALDSQVEIGQSDAIQTINRELRRIAREHRGVYILDYDALIARHGRLHWQDERKLLSVGLPIVAPQLIHLASEWLRFLIPLSGKMAKALVVDLDNTLWGGVIGEDGMSGIQLGTEYPGSAYQLLQRALLDLSRKGILLAICSKNNADDAMEALEKHPGMLLRPANFAAMRINWNDKAQGLREIAAELKIGLDSLAFLDDNPFEREQVRAALPEVLVMDLPEDSIPYESTEYESMKADPMRYAALVRDCPAFERLTLSVEDRQRTVFYTEQRERARAENSFSSKEDFCRYLQQEAEIAPVEPMTLARISQLTQKTNQFNLTTRRYGEQQVAELAAKPGCQVLSIRVKDRFGDHGLVGVAITCDEEDTCAIDTFLLSCRVIGRSIESVLLSHLVRNAKARGCTRLAGWFLPTKKNVLARDFYRQNGFECQAQNGNGSLWVLDLQKQQVTCPDWIRLNVVGLNLVNGGRF